MARAPAYSSSILALSLNSKLSYFFFPLWMGRAWYYIHKLRPAAIPGRVLPGSRISLWVGTGKHMVYQTNLGENRAKPLPGTGLWSRTQGEHPISGAKTHSRLRGWHMGFPPVGRCRKLGMWSAGVLSMARQHSQGCQTAMWELSDWLWVLDSWVSLRERKSSSEHLIVVSTFPHIILCSLQLLFRVLLSLFLL